MGYLSEALLNFLVRLGWSHGDDEIFSINDMKRLFDPNHLSKSSSTFNQTKLEWLNAHYIKTANSERILDELDDLGVNLRNHPKKELLIDQYRERSKTLLEMANSINSLLNSPQSYDEKAYNKFINENSLQILAEFSEILEPNLVAIDYEEATMKFLESKGAKLKDLAQAVRVAVTGTSVSPSIFEVIEILGSECVKERISKLLAYAKQ
ncbi:MAG: glutamate--tRNA ligase, partial [Campylobacter sp.]|nr:glutamate--tRNA ligase [Campylobacter sp.]